MSPIASAGVPANAANADAGVSNAAMSISRSRAVRGVQPRATSPSEILPAAMLVMPRAKKGIQVRAPMAASDMPRSLDRYCGIQNI